MSTMVDGVAVSSAGNGRSIAYRNLRPALPWQPLLVEDVVRRSPVRNANSRQQTTALVDAFNSRSMEAFGSLSATVTTSWLRGKRVPPGDFVFFQRNQVPCMSQEHDRPLARCITLNPAVSISRVRTVAKTEPVCSVLGSHIINVPVGYYARITTGSARQPELLDEGPHVIHDPTLVLAMSSYLVEKSTAHINHGQLHLLRVPPGKVAQVWYGVQAVLLESQTEPYVVVSPLFRFEKLVDQSAALISHGTSHRVRVPRGRLAKVWVDNVPLLLSARQEHYEYVTPYFSCAAGDWLVDSNEKLVVHGSIKRIMPSTGEVCVAYENGGLIVINPNPSGKAYLTDNETFNVDGFLSTNWQTLVFPSEETKAARRRESVRATDDEINFLQFNTRDSLKIGIKILLVYQVIDPSKILLLLKRGDIVNHIENLATVDMGKAIQRCSSQEFLCFTSTQASPTRTPTVDLMSGLSSNAAPLQHFTDIVKNALAGDLQEYGIRLIRLNVETPKVLDKDIAHSMEQQSLRSAQSNAEESLLQQQYLIARTRAEQEAKVNSIRVEQENRNRVTSAQAELEAARIRSDAIVVAEMGVQKAAALRGKQFEAQPVLLQLELAKLQADALQAAKVTLLVSPDSLQPGLGNLLLPAVRMQAEQTPAQFAQRSEAQPKAGK